MTAAQIGEREAVSVELRHLVQDIGEIKSRLTNVEATGHEIKVHMAELIGKFATVDAVLKMQHEIDTLKAEISRSKGIASASWMLIGLIFTIANLAIASKGKIW